jgi:uncharacterized membrane protein YgcG
MNNKTNSIKIGVLLAAAATTLLMASFGMFAHSEYAAAWKKIDKANNQSTSNIKIKQDCGSQGKGGYGGHGGDGGNTNGDPSAGGGGGSGGGGGPMTTCIAKIYNIQG